MTETWLRTNRRAVILASILPSALGLAGLYLIWAAANGGGAWRGVLGGLLALVAIAALAALAAEGRRPRLAYRDGELLAKLRSGPPIRVPIEIVECFWLGQAASLLPGKRHERTEAASLVIRLAESAAEWRHLDVKPQLASWCEGYITIRGTWCEPLSIDLVNRLNQRLVDVQREHAAVSATQPAPTWTGESR